MAPFDSPSATFQRAFESSKLNTAAPFWKRAFSKQLQLLVGFILKSEFNRQQLLPENSFLLSWLALLSPYPHSKPFSSLSQNTFQVGSVGGMMAGHSCSELECLFFTDPSQGTTEIKSNLPKSAAADTRAGDPRVLQIPHGSTPSAQPPSPGTDTEGLRELSARTWGFHSTGAQREGIPHPGTGITENSRCTVLPGGFSTQPSWA